MNEAALLNYWLVNDGDFVEKGTEIVEILLERSKQCSTKECVTCVEGEIQRIKAPLSGKIRIKAKEGTVLTHGAEIFEIDTD